jgi:hypothetical protein
MTRELVVDDEQARLIVESRAPIAIRDRRGRVLGRIVREDSEDAPPRTWSAERIGELEQRLDSDGPWYSTEEVLEHLKTLESS